MIRTEYIEPEVIPFRTLKKSVWNGKEWEVYIFHEMKKKESEKRKIVEWLQEHYGRSGYVKTWWTTFDSVVMRDIIYTHWKLLE